MPSTDSPDRAAPAPRACAPRTQLPRWARAGLGALAALVLALTTLTPGTHARAAAGSHVLNPGESLRSGQRLVTPDGRLVLEITGGVTVRRGGVVTWRNAALDQRASRLVMQHDGNLVLSTAQGVPLWHTGTYGRGPAVLRLQGDGNLVLYSGSTGRALWASGINESVSQRRTGTLTAGQSLHSQDGLTTLTMQGDGNLVLYRRGKVLWASRTNVRGSHALLDGRTLRVITPGDGRVVWSSAPGSSATLVLGNDGNLVLYGPHAVWHTDSYQPNCRAVTGPIPSSQAIAGVNGTRLASCYVAAWNRMARDAQTQGVSLSGGGWRDTNRQIQLRIQNCGGNTAYNIWERPSRECSPPTAIPGRSNHERGLAVDLTNSSARSTRVHQWMAANGARYGFYNYPPEPWHWSIDGQ